MKHLGGGDVINRDPARHILVEKICALNECEKIILKEICMHEA
jgi:hypothetical protein